MRRLYLIGCGVALLSGCGSEMTAPRVLSLRLVPPSFVPGLFTAGVATSPPAAASTLSAGQAVVGKPLTVALQVVDQNNTPVPGIAVSWSALPGGGSLDSATSVSDTGGVVRVDWTLDTIVKLDSLQASLAPGNGVVVTAGGVHAAPVPAVKVSGDAQTVTLGSTSSPFVLRVTDRFGNPVGKTLVAWNVITGVGTLSQITTATDANGLAEVTFTAGAAPSDGRVLATFGTMPAVTFSFKAQ
jgi:hypothetical protein